ncbi:unnamed protein product [Strongylus vulgaris]|uniref:Uncharacterized protein n=1 Tax=Strongylus vulgaris TaxID=40348 RepID=A0A3P7J9M6_STRVU|nr:unnamed protein product [Strongylus vulgaris]
MSIDIDGFDVSDAPAVGTPEEHGIRANEFLRAVLTLDLSKLLATEIACGESDGSNLFDKILPTEHNNGAQTADASDSLNSTQVLTSNCVQYASYLSLQATVIKSGLK